MLAAPVVRKDHHRVARRDDSVGNEVVELRSTGAADQLPYDKAAADRSPGGRPYPYADLTAVTRSDSDSLASPKSIDVFGL
jgi:hypothetical protein